MRKSLTAKLNQDNPVITAIECLNHPRKEKIGVRNKLAELVAIWQEAERYYEAYIKEWNKAFDRFSKGGGKIEDLAPPKRFRLKLPIGCPPQNDIEKKCRIFLPDVGDRHRPLVRYASGAPSTEWDEALTLFVPMIVHSDPHHLAGPCPHCGKYFLKTRSNRLYCKHACAAAHTASIATKRSREAEHRTKIQRAGQRINEWTPSRRHPTWQAFVIAKEPEISPRWLTRAVGRGELTPPSSTALASRRHRSAAI